MIEKFDTSELQATLDRVQKALKELQAVEDDLKALGYEIRIVQKSEPKVYVDMNAIRLKRPITTSKFDL